MTDASIHPENSQEAGKKSFWFIVLGVVVLIAGGIAAANLLVATVVSVLFVGAMMLAGGIIEIVHSFTVKTWGGFFLWFLTGLLYAAAGLLTFYNPLLASAILTLLIAASLVAAGLVRIWAGISQRRSSGWGWMVAAGVLTLLVGLLIMLRWPVNSLWVLGIFLAVDLMFQGWSYIAYGFGLRSNPAIAT
ncbi:HdeD family acid-resistance protein [Aquamicrobium sp. LC103]|uniref:HdeD family acid-resistance protein n=1 Tax=Aquamicrobium sp. LC103 TaxID=1120658 RepID=UPI00063E768B|nr:HdeD family acid-resistance protein [Aquamicrobium sp. LC103]TKT69086.1 HdeD family acid-resistance protein [Aquamicrobium sp. LC103]